MSEGPTRPQRPRATGKDGEGELQPGDKVGVWTIVRRLGGGGFGAVYEANDGARRVAIKVLHAQLATSPQVLARFQREIDVLERLTHPSIVEVLDAGFDAAGRPYLCMDLLSGRDLAAVLREHGPLPPIDAYRILEPLCDALALAHREKIVHRDLKASNVFVCDDTQRIVLLDFGIAKISDALAPELTATHQSLGTPGCMAPEQIRGDHIDQRTDVYALGGLMFHILTGRMPFRDPSETMTQYLHLHARRPRASAVVAALPPRIDDVIVRALAIEPGSRFDTVDALRAAFRGVLHESRLEPTTVTAEHIALYVTVTDTAGGAALDESLIADLEGVLPATERWLAERGIWLALDLGSSAVFVGAADAIRDPVQLGRALAAELAARPHRDRRVHVGIALHRGTATVIGTHVEPCALLRPDTWGMPDYIADLWLSPALAGPRQ